MVVCFHRVDSLVSLSSILPPTTPHPPISVKMNTLLALKHNRWLIGILDHRFVAGIAFLPYQVRIVWAARKRGKK